MSAGGLGDAYGAKGIKVGLIVEQNTAAAVDLKVYKAQHPAAGQIYPPGRVRYGVDRNGGLHRPFSSNSAESSCQASEPNIRGAAMVTSLIL